LLIEIARACEDAGNDDRKESLHQFFGMVPAIKNEL
jgi:ribosomal RNA-processing protein 12